MNLTVGNRNLKEAVNDLFFDLMRPFQNAGELAGIRFKPCCILLCPVEKCRYILLIFRGRSENAFESSNLIQRYMAVGLRHFGTKRNNTNSERALLGRIFPKRRSLSVCSFTFAEPLNGVSASRPYKRADWAANCKARRTA
jgi:hypothetical protein